MPQPSPLAIATSSLQRLAREESSYHKELEMQQRSIERLEKSQEDEDDEEKGNAEFKLKQERKALEETKAVFPKLRERILSAREKVEGLLEVSGNKDDEDVLKAKKVLEETMPL